MGAQERPELLPISDPQWGEGQICYEQPRAGENQPQLWGVPLPACSAWVLGWGWEGEERPGAGCCCLGEGASLTSSRAAISHAVRTLNLKGPCVPASEQAGFCF